MRTSITVTMLSILLAASALHAQTQTPGVVRLTVDDAVKMALDHNVDLNADRLDPQISDTRVAAASALFRPTFNTGVNRNNQVQPPSSFLIPTPTQSDAVTSSAGLSQRLPWYGTSYNVAWNAVHTNSNSFLSSYDPLVTSGLTLGISQPLVRDLSIDAARQNLITSRINRDIADTRLRESIVHTTANTKSAYWGLVAAIANVDARTSTLALSQELVARQQGQGGRRTVAAARSRVGPGGSGRQRRAAHHRADARSIRPRTGCACSSSIPTDRSVWNLKIEPIDSPPIAQPTLDVDAAVTRALGGRTDLVRSKKDIDNADATVKYAANQKLPDVRAERQLRGQRPRAARRCCGPAAFPAPSSGPGSSMDFGSVLNQLFSHNYPTWVVGVSLSYPLGQSNEEANYARARLERVPGRPNGSRAARARAIQQVRDAA